MQVVNEPGLYSLIFKSKKEEAKQFKRWVTHEVLPSIRKTGSYSVSKEISDFDLLTLFWNDIVRKHRKIVELEAKIKKIQKPLELAFLGLYTDLYGFGIHRESVSIQRGNLKRIFLFGQLSLQKRQGLLRVHAEDDGCYYE